MKNGKHWEGRNGGEIQCLKSQEKWYTVYKGAFFFDTFLSLLNLSPRTTFSFLSGVYVYAVAWALLGQDSGDSLGPDNLPDFAVSEIISNYRCQSL